VPPLLHQHWLLAGGGCSAPGGLGEHRRLVLLSTPWRPRCDQSAWQASAELRRERRMREW